MERERASGVIERGMEREREGRVEGYQCSDPSLTFKLPQERRKARAWYCSE